MLTIKVTGVQDVLKQFDHQKAVKVIKATLNRSARVAKTETSSAIREEWNIRKYDLDRKIIVKGAVGQDLKAELSLRGKPISMMYFDPIQIAGGRITRVIRAGRTSIAGAQFKVSRAPKRGYAGVTAQIKRKHKTVLTHAFMARGRGGIPLVFVRSSKVRSTVPGRQGLLTVKIVSEVAMFNEKIENRVIDRVSKYWWQELTRQIALMKAGKSWSIG